MIKQREQDKKDREERIKRKKAHKLAKQISQQKAVFEEQIRNTVIQSGQPVEDIQTVDIREFQPQEEPAVFALGGLLGEILLLLQTLKKLNYPIETYQETF